MSQKCGLLDQWPLFKISLTDTPNVSALDDAADLIKYALNLFISIPESYKISVITVSTSQVKLNFGCVGLLL